MKSIKEFKLIECRGTAYEIGFQWGEGCRENIIMSLENSLAGMNLMYQVPKEIVISEAMKFFPMIQEFDPYLVEIMRGQAAGAGVSLEEIVTQKCMNELMFYHNQISAMCTAFAATGKATAGGQTLVGQNVDWLIGSTFDFLKIYHNDGPVQYILSFANSTEFTLSSAGYGNCANATIGKEYSLNLPLACYLPKVMRQKNMQEAMGLLKQVARGLGYYHLADANGQIIGIESVHNDFEILLPQRDLLLHSNHYLTERYKANDAASEFIPDSFHRLERIKNLTEDHYGSITPQIMMDIMADHEAFPYSICHHIDENSPAPAATLVSYIMVPAESAIYIACGNPCEVEYVRYEL